jgi:protein SCO1/2
MKRLLLWIFMLVIAGHAAASDALPGHSVYQFNAALTDQSGHGLHWADRRGHVQIVSMFYTSCAMVCPMIVDTMKLTANAMDAKEASELELLLISFDAAHDSTAVLHDYAQRRKLEAPTWTLAHAERPG